MERNIMSIVVNIYYSGENGAARKFADEMISSSTVDAIRNEAGNIKYDYFLPIDDEETVLGKKRYINLFAKP
jgi:quinol monooxygenase YgiN